MIWTDETAADMLAQALLYGIFLALFMFMLSRVTDKK